MRCWVLLLLLVSLFQVQLSFAVVGMEKSDSAAEESTYIVSLKRELTKDHYDELIRSVKERHDDSSDKKFGANIKKEMKMLKMFTVTDPTNDALTFLREHDYVKSVQADGVVYAAKDEM